MFVRLSLPKNLKLLPAAKVSCFLPFVAKERRLQAENRALVIAALLPVGLLPTNQIFTLDTLAYYAIISLYSTQEVYEQPVHGQPVFLQRK